MCKHLVTRCRIFRGHLLGKTTCLMLQLVLISDLHFPSLSDMFEFAFFYFEIYKQGGSACLTVTAQRRHCQCMVIWKRDVFSTYLLFKLNCWKSCCTSVFLHFKFKFPIQIRRPSVSFSIHFRFRFDDLPIHLPWDRIPL